MVSKRKVEWYEEKTWRSVKVELSFTKNMNYTFKHAEKRYVFKDLRAGTEVLRLQGSGWVVCGRIDKYGTIFLGEGESYSEMNERINKDKSPEQLIAELKAFMGR
jgi:hypothetical protein